MKRICTWFVVLGLVLSAGAVSMAEPIDGPRESAQTQRPGGVGAGVLSVVANLFYIPAKTVYAVSGGLVAGVAYAFSGGDADVVGPIVNASLRGDYVILPAHIRGQDKVDFVGRKPVHEMARIEAEVPAALPESEGESAEAAF